MTNRDLPFSEWYRQQELKKTVARGGVRTPVSPGFGMMGPQGRNNQGATGPNAGYAHPGYPPAAPGYGGNIGLPAPGNTGINSPSKYSHESVSPPTPWIDDVDMANNWFCYDDQTEILTSHRGWQKFSDLTDEDSVASLDATTKTMFWSKPEKRPEFDYVGELISFKSRGLDLLVSPNHRMVVNKLTRACARRLGVSAVQGEGLFFVPAEVLHDTINHHVGIPVASLNWRASDIPGIRFLTNSGVEINISGEDYCSLLGLFLSEGSIQNDIKGNPLCVLIWQKYDSKHLDRIYWILHRCFGEEIKYRDHLGSRNDPGYFEIRSRELAEHLKQFGNKSYEKFIPLAVRNASKEQLFAFLSAYMLGDGEFAEDQSSAGRGVFKDVRLPPSTIHGRIITASRLIADQIQEIALKLGYSARIETLDRQYLVGHIIKKANGDEVTIKSIRIAYRVSIIGTENVNDIRVSKINYSGKIFCVTVPTGIVYVRRNGKPCWSGNSPFQPIWPFGPPYINTPREWDYPVGYNLNFIPGRIDLMKMLRGMRASWGVLATIIETRKDQLLRIPWTIQQRNKPRQGSKSVAEMRKFFRRPDQKLSYSQWSRKLMDDLLVIDAPTIYFPKDRLGRPLSAEIIDGATVFPLIDDAGRRPDSIIEMTDEGISYLRRQPAFQQIIKGMPMIDLDESELTYCPMRPRADLPIFGYPPTEQILIESTEAIRKTFYQADFWLSGNIPDLIITVPNEWGPRQISMFQAHFDALLSGNLSLKSKVRFVPGGMKPFDIKNADGQSLWSQRDETLIRLACYAYSVSPTPFIKQTNRATAQNAQQTAEEEGLYPLMSYWKDDIIDPIIQERFGYDDIEFVFLPTPEPDAEKQSKIHDLQIKNGSRSRNEIRTELGLEPEPGGDIATIEIGNAVIPVEEAALGNAMPMLGAKPSGFQTPNPVPPTATGGKPQLGSPTDQSKPNPTPIHKSIGDIFVESLLSKATSDQLHEASQEATGDLDALSHKQLANGNYRKGHIWIQGLDISIENAPGSLRGEKDESGKKWQVRMPSAYGYIRGYIGADGDNIDCYLGPDPRSDLVWIIDQNVVTPKGKVKKFDEHKCMIGYDSLEAALKDYLESHFDGLGHERCRRVTEMSFSEFKDFLKNGDLKSPVAKQDFGDVVLKKKDSPEDFVKSDTISSSTGLNWYDQTVPVKTKLKRKRKIGSRWKQLSSRLDLVN